MPLNRPLSYLLLSFFLVSCSIIEKHRLNIRYGASEPAHRQAASTDQEIATQESPIDFHNDVRPILNKRCVVCHGCYDAPCQLKLSSIEGLERGASKTRVYNAARLKAAQPSRLFEDAQTVEQWRKREFFPVLNERQQHPAANLDSSVMAKLLMQKQAHPLPDQTPLPDTFDFSLENAKQCVSVEEYPNFAQKNPLWGMPYGLPQLPQQEYQTLIQWLSQGAKYANLSNISSEEQALISHWEQFLNNDSLKHQLMSRYIYEHLYIARLYFSGGIKTPEPSFYRLVRSSTPPGQPVNRIVTRRPYGDPGVERVFYRIIPDNVTTLAKTHMPYRLDAQRMKRYHSLFIQADYEVSELPGYQLESASNPFITFAAIPPASRYKFMLDEAEFTIMGFIKGPVCRGQIALNVIQDHFWVFFVNPELEKKELKGDFLQKNLKYMNLPAKDSSSALILNWRKYSKQQRLLLKNKSKLIDEVADKLDINAIWNGENKNTNAALTVFRHFDSASVVKGLVGKEPKTAWVIDYPLLERIHYLLVSGFDVYGNYGHQLNTRLYMDFLRMEGEFNFLAFLPKKSRINIRDEWYAEASDMVKDYLYGQYAYLKNEPAIEYQSNDHKHEFIRLLKEHLGYALNQSYQLSESQGTVDAQLLLLEELKGKGVNHLPQVIFLMIEENDNVRAYSLIHNNAHLNISHLFNEGSRRISDEDTITVVKGFVGSYPNRFLKIKKQQVPALVDAIRMMQTEADYLKLLGEFAVRRNEQRFWPVSDKIHALYKQSEPIKAGLFDFNRLENR